MPEYQIVTFEPRFQPDFYRINAAWIEAHYTLEDEDHRMLSDPQAHIIDKGGQVFFLLAEGKVAATCGVYKLSDTVYELIRMSVDKPYRGHGYGGILVKHAIEWAAVQGAREVILETGKGRTTAIALYEQMGFEHYTPRAEHLSGLARADVFMRYEVPLKA